MAQSYSNIHPVNEILSQFASEASKNLDAQLIAPDLFEGIQLNQGMKSGTILVENNSNFMGTELDLLRAPGSSRARQSTFDFSSTTYQASAYGIESSIPTETLEDSQWPVDMLQREVRKNTRSLMLAREQAAANLLFTPANWTGYTNTLANFAAGVNTDATGTQWGTTGAEPLTDLQAISDTVRQNAFGMDAPMQTLVLGYRAFLALQRNPEVRGYLGAVANGLSSGSRILPEAEVIAVLKSIFSFVDVKVGKARVNNANPGQTQTQAQIWTDDSMWLGVLKSQDGAQVSTSGNVRTSPAAVVSLTHGGLMSGAYDSLDKTRKNVWCEHVYQDKIIVPQFGYLVSDLLA